MFTNQQETSNYEEVDQTPQRIPNLLLISDDVINPMKVVFETAGRVICNKNEKLTVENTDATKVLINIECLDDETRSDAANSQMAENLTKHSTTRKHSPEGHKKIHRTSRT